MSVYSGDLLSDLVEAVESLYAQSFQDFDIFVQLDGCIDENLENYLDNEFEKRNIFLINKRKENKGLAYSLNELLRIVLARDYAYIARMDADDVCESDRFFQQSEFMESNNKCDVVGCNIIEFYDDGTTRECGYQTTHMLIKAGFAKKTAIPHVSAFFRRSFFEKAGLYNVRSNRNEDQWLWLSGFVNGCIFASIPQVLMRVRLSTNLLKRRQDFKHNLDTFKLRNRIIHTLKFHKIYYLYNVIVLFLKMQPPTLLKIIYKLR
jgi:glycosyltransferase involved in cell wall biosynthesis